MYFYQTINKTYSFHIKYIVYNLSIYKSHFTKLKLQALQNFTDNFTSLLAPFNLLTAKVK